MTINDILTRASTALKAGDMATARATLDAALIADPDRPELLNFAGMLAAGSGARADAIVHFERLHKLQPNDPGARYNLATALVAAERLDDAERLITGFESQPKLFRLLAQIAQLRGDAPRAVGLYEAFVAHDPADWAAWNNLGNARSAAGDIVGAIAAIDRAIALRPRARELHLNLALQMSNVEPHEPRATRMRAAAALFPGDAEILTELGLAEAAVQDFDAAERAFARAIAADPQAGAAYLELALLYENRNRLDDLATLVAQAEDAALDAGALAFIKAWHLRRSGDLAGALALAQTVPDSVNPIRRAQLIAELADRLGETDQAFAAFVAMNEAAVASRPARRDAEPYRAHVEAALARLDDDLGARWQPHQSGDKRRDPAFIVGFPRSGTTLVDTMLMNAPQLHVMEELPVLARIMTRPGAEADLATLPAEQIETLRALYFETAQALSPIAPEPSRIVDKHPLHMAQVPLIHRLFPQASIIFVERHPCDAVLSCFMANFQLNGAMRSFVDLREAALTYDAVMQSWTRARALLPVSTVALRYERMVADPATELRRATDFLGLGWRDEMIDNRGMAAQRGHVRTASYSQVTEPIYTRSAYRWLRYRKHLEPVLPILAPWAERLGYTMDAL